MSSGNKHLVLMDANRIQRSSKRMTYEIVEKNSHNKPVLFLGIDERGYAMARELAGVLKGITAGKIEFLQLSLKNGDTNKILETLDKAQDAYIIVVDDVIFSGKTMFEALNEISGYINPPELHTAVMIDRGHRKFPIKAEFCGMELPTKLNEHVSVKVENDEIKQIVLINS